MGDVVELGVETTLPVPPEKILRAALADDLASVVVIGYDADGKLVLASSDPDAGAILWLLEMGKRRLFEDAADRPAEPERPAA